MRCGRGLLVLGWLVSASAFAAEIILIYPRTPDDGGVFSYPSNLDSSFVFGHISPPIGDLYVNGRKTAYNKDGAFLAFLPIQRSDHGGSWNLTLDSAGTEIARRTFDYGFLESPADDTENGIMPITPRMLSVSRENARCLTGPGGAYFVFPEIGCHLLAVARLDKFYQVDLGDDFSALIDTTYVAALTDFNSRLLTLGNGSVRDLVKGAELKLALSRPVPWTATLSQDLRELGIQFYGTISAITRIRFENSIGSLFDVRWEQNSYGTMIRFFSSRPISGYAVDHDSDSLQIRLKLVSAKRHRTLKGKIIVLDAGHGGTQLGAVGPLGTREKDVNLNFCKLLAAELIHSGADVRLTRTEDRDLELYERVQVARQSNADFFLSLHSNALPDGENPASRRGTGTYYYHAFSRPAAEAIHRRVVRATHLNDDGIFYADFAVLRPTEFPAVLLEAAYIMRPDEERMLQSEAFLKRLSKAIVAGLKDYFAQEQ